MTNCNESAENFDETWRLMMTICEISDDNINEIIPQIIDNDDKIPQQLVESVISKIIIANLFHDE